METPPEQHDLLKSLASLFMGDEGVARYSDLPHAI
jgi:hypothetical protein